MADEWRIAHAVEKLEQALRDTMADFIWAYRERTAALVRLEQWIKEQTEGIVND